jgi:hypothetical protein
MDEVSKDFLAHGWDINQKIGIFYDDPQDIDTAKLRSDIGIVVKSSDFQSIDQLSGSYLTQILPQNNRLTTLFPYTNKLSFVVGVFRAYPLINKYLKEHNYVYNLPRIEIYDTKNIQYLVELKQ